MFAASSFICCYSLTFPTKSTKDSHITHVLTNTLDAGAVLLSDGAVPPGLPLGQDWIHSAAETLPCKEGVVRTMLLYTIRYDIALHYMIIHYITLNYISVYDTT